MKKWILGLVLLAVFPTFGKGTVGENVTRFEFEQSPQSAMWVNGYVQSFFTNRIDIGPTLFPREYLAISDCWLNDAQREGRSPIRSSGINRPDVLSERLMPMAFRTTTGLPS